MNKQTAPAVDRTQLPQPILPEHPEWIELYDFAWDLAARHVRTSRGKPHLDTAWDRSRNLQWVWDLCITALYCRYGGNLLPYMETLDFFYDFQAEDGFICMTYDFETGEGPWPDRINPPLFAWVEWEHYLVTGDSSRFAHATDHIERLMHWIDANRRTQPHPSRDVFNRADPSVACPEYSLYFFKDAGSSGMDDCPRAPRMADAGQFVDWIDLSAQMVLSFRMLSRMHAVLDNDERSRHWSDRAEELSATINRELWCERTRFYHDRFLPTNFVGHKTAAAFWTLLAEVCPPDRVEALVEHLMDEKEFNRPTPVPSLSADDLNYSPEGRYWLGGVWAPTNYMITRGLMKVGRTDTAHRIAVRYLGALARTYQTVDPPTLWECYAPEDDMPGVRAYSSELAKPHFVGWSGVGPVAMLIENILGLDIDAPHNRLTWDIRLTEEHGIKNLAVGRGHVDLRCAGRSAAADPANVQIQADAALDVQVRRHDHSATLHVKPGQETRATI